MSVAPNTRDEYAINGILITMSTLLITTVIKFEAIGMINSYIASQTYFVNQFHIMIHTWFNRNENKNVLKTIVFPDISF